MSGGHFDYQQYRCNDIADEIERVIGVNDSTEKNEWGEDYGKHFTPETIERFKEAAHYLRRAEEMAQRIDWLLSGDDSEETFHERWEEEVRK